VHVAHEGSSAYLPGATHWHVLHEASAGGTRGKGYPRITHQRASYENNFRAGAGSRAEIVVLALRRLVLRGLVSNHMAERPADEI
jgi:hypothetical protein